MDKQKQNHISRFLSYVLRHHPENIGIKLDNGGWADVSELLRAAEVNGQRITLDELETVVKENDKQRFSFSIDGQRIRANQGHSIPVDLGCEEMIPPEILYHGTACQKLESIHQDGILRGNRQHVHLSPDPDTATKVGQRHGKPIVLKVQARQMHSKGYKFYLSDNGIWLTEHIPPEYLILPNIK
jgi:putative RNA 2'-phosphotransferase